MTDPGPSLLSQRKSNLAFAGVAVTRFLPTALLAGGFLFGSLLLCEGGPALPARGSEERIQVKHLLGLLQTTAQEDK